MDKRRAVVVALAAIAIMFLVYSPHLEYKFPYHVDEWHHITEALKLREGEYSGKGMVGFRVGFHIFLAGVSYFTDLVKVYHVFPALWAVVSCLVVFYVAREKTKRFPIALFAMIFFGSIKSNVNITGLWFFTPLSFSIPFIFLYIYFFTEGIQKENKKFTLASLAIMAFLIFVHPIAVLFSVPFLAVYCIIYREYIIKEWKFFSIFAVIPVMGVLFYSAVRRFPIHRSINELILNIPIFRQGWGALETSSSFLELYSIAGYALALIGVAGLYFFHKKPKKYIVYVLWPAAVLAFMIFYRLRGISYLVPYQRNMYYFALGLPVLSALGLYFVIETAKSSAKKLKSIHARKLVVPVILILALFLTFKPYYDIPPQLRLYRAIDNEDYEAMIYMSSFPKSTVMAGIFPSSAIYAVAGHYPVGTITFYGNRGDVKKFFDGNCTEKEVLIEKHNVSYVYSEESLDCGWGLIYSNKRYIYEAK